PNDPGTADTLGWILYKKHQYPQALALLQDAATKLTNLAEVQYHFAMANYMVGDEDAARSGLETALKLDTNFPGVEEARQRLAFLKEDPAKAAGGRREALEKRVADNPDDPTARLRLADAYQRSGDTEKALKTYQLV